MAIVVVTRKRKIGARSGWGRPARDFSYLRPNYIPKTAPCQDACPNHNAVREMITTITLAGKHGQGFDQSLAAAFDRFTEESPFPATCGRICPHPCESRCNRLHKDGAVNINLIERFVGDYALERRLPLKRLTPERQSHKVAVIGSGPGGLSTAYHLVRRGYPVTVFESRARPGGMLRFGIPSFRLPVAVVEAEIQRILDLGVELCCNTAIGRDISWEDLRRDFDAVVVTIGAHKARKLAIPNADVTNLLPGTAFLAEVNAGRPIDLGSRVLVIGGGDTAIDAARVARRLGVETVTLFRWPLIEPPRISDEIDQARLEGIDIRILAAPVEIVRGPGNRAVAVKCLRMELGEADAAGIRWPVPIDGDEFALPVDFIIAALGQEADFDLLRDGHGFAARLSVDESFETPAAGVFAGGDVLKPALVIDAIAHGRTIATAIDGRFRGKLWEDVRERLHPVISPDRVKLTWYEPMTRTEAIPQPPEERLTAVDREVNPGLDESQCLTEARRCLSCGQCFRCDTCWSFCQDNAIVKPMAPGEPFHFNLDFCQGCRKCAEECPCGYIEMI